MKYAKVFDIWQQWFKFLCTPICVRACVYVSKCIQLRWQLGISLHTKFFKSKFSVGVKMDYRSGGGGRGSGEVPLWEVWTIHYIIFIHVGSFSERADGQAGYSQTDATADVLWHCNHRPPGHLGSSFYQVRADCADFLLFWIGKIERTYDIWLVGIEPSTPWVKGKRPIHCMRLWSSIANTRSYKIFKSNCKFIWKPRSFTTGC